ncbi:MAG: hypothetical protein Alpg2KO_21990 [Alphaproteobacteria bacterium]
MRLSAFRLPVLPALALAVALTVLPGCGARSQSGYHYPPTEHHQPMIEMKGDQAAAIRDAFMKVMNRHDFSLSSENDGVMIFDRPANLPMKRTIPGMPAAPKREANLFRHWFGKDVYGRAYGYRVRLDMVEQINGLPYDLPPLATLESEDMVEKIVVHGVRATAVPMLFTQEQEVVIGQTDLSRAVYGLHLQNELDQIEAMILRPGEQDAFLSSTVTPHRTEYGYPGEPPGRYPEGLTNRGPAPLEDQGCPPSPCSPSCVPC